MVLGQRYSEMDRNVSGGPLDLRGQVPERHGIQGRRSNHSSEDLQHPAPFRSVSEGRSYLEKRNLGGDTQ